MINILGLALGIACSLLIMLWVKDERSFDAFHEHGSQLYQVYERWHFDGKEEASYPTQGLLAEELQRIVPEIVYASSMDRASAPGSLSTFEANSKINKMEGVFVGNDFLRMFSFPVLQGSAMNALNRPEAIAISHKMADLFFGSPANAIGKTMRFENKEDLEVTAVFENVPANSSLQFDFLRSWMAFVQQNDWVHNWGNTSPATFVQLRTDANPEKVEAKIKDFLYHFQQKQSSVYTELALQPFKDKYLHSTFKNGSIDGGRIEYVQLFTWIAIFIILIACINFMNLATARAVNRSKEVAVRKVVGAPRKALIKQFIGEAILLTFLSTLAGLFLADLLIPFFNQLTGKQLSL
ncbi:MAG TPA: ABC transporter permease, partial [Flavisolibacter sp.]|nr:ABC transporter permease [Flavisolibacter sp.]